MSDFWFYLSRAGLHAQLGMNDESKTDFQLGYGKLVDYYEGTEPHINYLRTLIWKKDEDLEHLRGIIKEIHNSTGWKILTKLDVLKKNDLSD
jgi:hypothetical protein